jgi:hypothetical protein
MILNSPTVSKHQVMLIRYLIGAETLVGQETYQQGLLFLVKVHDQSARNSYWKCLELRTMVLKSGDWQAQDYGHCQ